jgi:hypothetical protein
MGYGLCGIFFFLLFLCLYKIGDMIFI